MPEEKTFIICTKFERLPGQGDINQDEVSQIFEINNENQGRLVYSTRAGSRGGGALSGEGGS